MLKPERLCEIVRIAAFSGIIAKSRNERIRKTLDTWPFDPCEKDYWPVEGQNTLEITSSTDIYFITKNRKPLYYCRFA